MKEIIQSLLEFSDESYHLLMDIATEKNVNKNESKNSTTSTKNPRWAKNDYEPSTEQNGTALGTIWA